jgi:hypothetical protein
MTPLLQQLQIQTNPSQNFDDPSCPPLIESCPRKASSANQDEREMNVYSVISRARFGPVFVRILSSHQMFEGVLSFLKGLSSFKIC